METDKYLSNQNDKNKDSRYNIPGQSIIKKKKAKDLNQEILVNFQYDDYEEEIKYKPLFKKKEDKIYYDNIDILYQIRFKFILNNSPDEENLTTQNKSKINSSTNSNKVNSKICWDDISVVLYYSVNLYKCPICLDNKLVCPKITRCGHIFCWPCLVNYNNFWMVTSANKKMIKCPLCQEFIKIDQIRFCEIFNSVNYISWFDNQSNEDDQNIETKINSNENSFHTFITFNLIVKKKKAPILLNTHYDPDLEYYKKHHRKKNAFNFIPIENQEEFTFNRFFLTTPEFSLKRFNNLKLELEDALNEETTSSKDKNRLLSLNNCLEIINDKIRKINERNLNIPSDTKEVFNMECINDKSNNSNKILTNKEDTNPLNSNKDNYPFNIDFKNFFYFYQEHYGDIYYLHPINYAMLLSEYEREEDLPTEISGTILEIELLQTTANIKNKYPFLSHLPIGSIIFFVEVDMKNIVSTQTLKNYKEVLRERVKKRHNVKKEEEHYDTYLKNLKAKEERILSTEYSMMNQNLKISELFKNEIGLKEEEDLIVEKMENSIPDSNQINEIKENKLKSLFGEEINLKDKNISNKEINKFKFNDIDFPEIDENNLTNINCEEPVKSEDVLQNEKVEVDCVNAKPKINKSSKANKKKKKFSEINVELYNKISENQLENEGGSIEIKSIKRKDKNNKINSKGN